MIFRKYKDKRLKNELGFTLVEIMIALGILSYGILAVASMQSTSLLGTSRSNSVTTATNIAMDRMERLLALPFTTITNLSPSEGTETNFPTASPALPVNIEGFDWSVGPGPSPIQASTRLITVSVKSKDTNTPVTLTSIRLPD